MTAVIHVRYYALLKEAAGKDEEEISTSAATAHDLFEEIRCKYNLPYGHNSFKVSINSEFMNWDTGIEHGDEVGFIPPVAGG